jgi:hypothetical protein
MSYLGDIAAAQVLYFHFTTRQFSTGAPITSASLAISVYKDDSTTQSTAGITTTFTSGFDSVAGLVSVKIDTSADGTFYAAGHDFSVVITTGTADSVSIVGEVVGYFSIANRSALRPTTAGRTLDVSAGGEAGVDWANVGSPTTSLALTGTTIATTQQVDVNTIKTNPVVNAGTVTFPTDATLASTTNITSATGITVSTNSDKTGYALTAAYDPAKTAAQAGDAMTLTAAYDFGKGTVAMTESYAANGIAPTPIQAIYAIQQMLMDFSISSTSYTVKKLNNSTTAFVVTLNDATNPTAAART